MENKIMKTKLELGKSVSDSIRFSAYSPLNSALNGSVYDSVNCSVDNSVWYLVDNSVLESFNNSMRWRIRL